MENEKNIYIGVFFFSIFQLLEMNEKKIIIVMKKKSCADLEWATAQLYFKRMGIVLQYSNLYCSEEPRMGWKCIAIHWFVLQRRRLSLYCMTVLYCDLEAARLGLYCRIVLW